VPQQRILVLNLLYAPNFVTGTLKILPKAGTEIRLPSMKDNTKHFEEFHGSYSVPAANSTEFMLHFQSSEAENASSLRTISFELQAASGIVSNIRHVRSAEEYGVKNTNSAINKRADSSFIKSKPSASSSKRKPQTKGNV
jgi:hypothetical protein